MVVTYIYFCRFYNFYDSILRNNVRYSWWRNAFNYIVLKSPLLTHVLHSYSCWQILKNILISISIDFKVHQHDTNSFGGWLAWWWQRYNYTLNIQTPKCFPNFFLHFYESGSFLNLLNMTLLRRLWVRLRLQLQFHTIIF